MMKKIQAFRSVPDRIFLVFYPEKIIEEEDPKKSFRKDLYKKLKGSDLLSRGINKSNNKGSWYLTHDKYVWEYRGKVFKPCRLFYDLKYPHAVSCYLNMNSLYRSIYDDFTDIEVGLHEENFLPYRQKFVDYSTIQEILKELIQELEKEIFGVWQRVFKLDCRSVRSSCKSIEIAEEFKADISEIEHNLYGIVGTKMTKYHNATSTLYINFGIKDHKIQLKAYQKAVGLTRVEYSLHNELANDVWQGLKMNDFHSFNFLNEIMKIKNKLNIFNMKILNLSDMRWLKQLSDSMNMSTEEMLLILRASSFDSTANNQPWIRKLRNRNLIEKEQRGKYIPTEFLLSLKREWILIKEEEI